jgi:hypothetical protein
MFTQRVTTFEALLRWRHPVRGNVPPAEFIPLAEEIGLIGEIGQWVLERACQDAAAWPPEHPPRRQCLAASTRRSPQCRRYCGRPALRLSGLAPIEAGIGTHRGNGDAGRYQPALSGPSAGDQKFRCRNCDGRFRHRLFRTWLSPQTSPSPRSKSIDRLSHKLPHDEHRHRGRHHDRPFDYRALQRPQDDLVWPKAWRPKEQLLLLMEANCTEVQGYLVGRPKPAKPTFPTL